MAPRPDLRAALRVEPGTRVRLAKQDHAVTHGWDKPSGEAATERQLERLADLQDRFWAEASRAVLVVLQGIDAAGKDGTIKKVMTAFNPQGSPVTSFKVPSSEELAHDYLWRVHRAVPRKGEIGIFNRSHYEDVLVVRVDELAPERVWRTRYQKINDFEREVAEAGTAIVKVMLHISYAEQGQRLLERLDDPTKHWKYNPGDLVARAKWADYQAAYAEALGRCSTDVAPWFVVPADRKWYRDWAVVHLVAETFAEMGLAYPEADFDVAAEKRRLEAEDEQQVNEV
jgi:PPK2 family polyphosphate:nucleotide phosphotransferase